MTTAFPATPSVSVILPTFNRLPYLRSAVASVFAQTLVDWELIIADDGSDECTRAYLSALQSEPRVSVIWLPHCGNPAAVRNCALWQARGEYLAFLDSDDEWLPMKLERQIAALRGCPQRRWSYTGYLIIDASGEPCGPAPIARPHRGAILELLLRHQVSIWTPAVVAERRLVAQAGNFDEQLLLFEDYDLWIRLACRSEIQFIDEPLTRVRRCHDQHHGEGEHGDSMRAGRHRSLEKLRRVVTDPPVHSLVERLYAQSSLEQASVRADTDRLGAWTMLLDGCTRSWRCMAWWRGLTRVLLKLAAPRSVLRVYRRGQVRRRCAAMLSAR
jgi:glycosyltransferase involved in cell wall biosynthesis